MNQQLDINFESARELGEQAANACLAKTHRADPQFSQRAATAILNHLRAVRQASGEELVDIAIAHGAHAHDQRAFGAVFAGLSRRGLIRTVGFCMREKGHGTAGGRVWELVH